MHGRQLWSQMVQESVPFGVPEHALETLYHRAASAWGSGQTLSIQDGIGGQVDLTQLFEQYRMLQILKGNE